MKTTTKKLNPQSKWTAYMMMLLGVLDIISVLAATISTAQAVYNYQTWPFAAALIACAVTINVFVYKLNKQLETELQEAKTK
jgi:uncharacterized membrane protein YcjF (UPF0283 family)